MEKKKRIVPSVIGGIFLAVLAGGREDRVVLPAVAMGGQSVLSVLVMVNLVRVPALPVTVADNISAIPVVVREMYNVGTAEGAEKKIARIASMGG